MLLFNKPWQAIAVVMLCLLFMTNPQYGNGAKILSIALFYPSHARVMKEIAAQLQARDHSVVLVISSISETVQDLHEYQFKTKYYQTPVTKSAISDCSAIALQNNDPLLTACYELIISDARAFSNDKKLLDELKNENFGKQLIEEYLLIERYGHEA